MPIDQLQEGLMSSFGAVASDIRAFVQEKPLTSAVAAGGIVAVTAGGIIAATRNGKKRTTKRRKARTTKGRSRDRKFRSKQKHELAYVKRKRKAGKKITRPRYKSKAKRTSKKRVGKIYYTKKGQPYKIMSSGKARFIKKRKGRR